MLSGFHKHNTQTFSQYFSPSQSWEILGISLVILLHLLWHGSPVPKRKNIRKAFIFLSTSLILKNIYCLSSSIPSPCCFPRSDVILLSYTSAGEGNTHGFHRVTSCHRLSLVPLRLLANFHQVKGPPSAHCQDNCPLKFMEIPDHESHAFFKTNSCWVLSCTRLN